MIEFSRLLALSTPDNLLWPHSSASFAPNSSKYESAIQVYQAEGLRWICNPSDAIQSVMSLESPHRLVLDNHHAMMLALLWPARLGAVLDLGMGAGALQRYLRQRVPQLVVTAVEGNALMVSLARQYFELPTSQPVHIDDAFEFIKRDTTRYDLIFCDLFNGRESPPNLQSPHFFANMERRLTPDGVLAINTLPASEQALSTLLQVARQAFAGVGLLQFQDLGNIVIILSKVPLTDASSLDEGLLSLKGLTAEDVAALRPFLARMIRV